MLWLLGGTLLVNGTGNAVDKVLIHYATAIADAEGEDDVVMYSWGSAVLAATYHGLCEACTKTDANGLLTGCPLLLQLWSYERIAIGRPLLEMSPYEDGLYVDGEDDQGPTMGTLWLCGREVRLYCI